MPEDPYNKNSAKKLSCLNRPNSRFDARVVANVDGCMNIQMDSKLEPYITSYLRQADKKGHL